MIISSKLKIIKLIRHSFQNIARHFGQKMETALFEIKRVVGKAYPKLGLG